MADWWKVDAEVIEMAEELIEKYHPSLEGASIGLIFRDEAPSSRGKLTRGKAQKVSGQKWQALLKEDQRLDFLIWLAWDQWDQMSTRHRRALLDHELTHCYIDADGQPKIRHHDLEEFHSIVRRHGFWKPEIETMAEAIDAARQLQIPFGELARETTVAAVGPDKAPAGQDALKKVQADGWP